MRYTDENYSKEKYEQDKKLVDAIHSRVPYFGKKRVQDALELSKILKEICGYPGLRVNPNNEENSVVLFSTLVRKDPYRILKAAETNYFAALRRINQFGNPEKKQKSKLESKTEDDGQLILF